MSVSSEEEETYHSSRKKTKGRAKGAPSPGKSPCRRIPRGHISKLSSQADGEYNEEGDDMDTGEETKGVDDETRAELDTTPKKKQRKIRQGGHAIRGKKC